MRTSNKFGFSGSLFTKEVLSTTTQSTQNTTTTSTTFTPKGVIVVSGATGFIGGRICEYLIDELLEIDSPQYRVRALGRSTSDFTKLISSKFRRAMALGIFDIHCADLASLFSVRQAFEFSSCDYLAQVFHCAAAGGDWGEYEDFYRSNALGTKNMVQAVSERVSPRFERFIHLSTIDVYPHDVPPSQCDEYTPIPTHNRRYHYTETKSMAEQFVKESSLPWTMLRLGVVFGAGSYSWGLQEAILLKKGLGVMIDGSRHHAGLVHVDDASRGIIDASRSQHTVRRIYNMTGCQNVTWRKFYNTLADELGVDRPTLSIPYWLAYWIAIVLEFIWRVFDLPDRPLLTLFVLRIVGQPQLWPTESARHDFHWREQVPFEKAIKKQANWIRHSSDYFFA